MSFTQKISVDLIEGAQNSFVVVSFLKTQKFSQKLIKNSSLRCRVAQKLCHQTQTDGCLFIYPSENYHFKWECLNSDGSWAIMCGNAARAICWWYFQKIEALSQVRFEGVQRESFTDIQSENQALFLEESDKNSLRTQDSIQVIQGEILEKDICDESRADVRVTLGPVCRIPTTSKDIIYDSGVPHNCYYQEDWMSLSLEEVFDQLTKTNDWKGHVQSLRFPLDLNSQGANVTYLWAPKFEKSLVSAISFERGVEGWTLACGTGAMAAACFAQDCWHFKSPVNVAMPGGDLSVIIEKDRTLLRGAVSVCQTLNVDV